MAYTDYFDEVQELYIAYYQRPADPEGLVFWAKELDKAGGNLNGIIEAFANSAESRALYGAVIDSSNIDTVITGIYQALFNRLPDEGGLLFYHNGFIEGKFTAATIMLNILDGATGQDRDYVDNKLAAANLFTETIDPGLDGNDIQAAYTDADLVSARAYLDLVTDDPGTVPTEAEAANFIRTHIAEPGDQISGSQTFTLQEIEDEVITLPGTLVEGSQLMWGYTPEDDGIPAEDMLSFLTTITGLDLTELGLIDNDGVGPFDNVASIALELEGALETDDIETGDLTITFEDGTSLSFLTDEAVISEMYFDFLNDLLFFEDPNTGELVSRLYMSDPVWVDADGNYIDGPTYTELIVGEPIVLTPQENNGGTLEEGFTTEMDTTIVAGRLELLHQAYIDAGGGYDILEVDAKGTYAQPLALLNIEEIQVQNLPNVYTATKTVYDYTDQNGECVYGSDCAPTYEGYNPDNDPNYNERIVTYSTYPDRTIDIGVAPGNLDSVLDLSRATAIEKLIVTEGRDTGMELGDLTIVGIRNGDGATAPTAPTARFEGGFTQDVTLHYGEGLTGELNVELAIGDIYSDINLLHNAAVLNIDSQGIENHMHSFFAGGSISRMNVTGTGAFGAEEDLNTSFNSDRPAIIDASANTGGLDVTLNGHYNVEIQGTMANDELTAESSGEVLINAYDGKNVIVVDDSDRVDITGGSGIDRISAQNGETVTIAAGDGENEINADGSETVDIVSGAGADTITAVGSETVMVDSGAGNDDITASALEIDIAAGAGDDNVVVAGLGGEGEVITIENKLDFVLLEDLSGSFDDDVSTVQALVPDLLSVINESSADAQWGLASFVDKPVDPFGAQVIMSLTLICPYQPYDLFPMDKYVGFNYLKKYVETYHSRGCPNGCTFCVGWTNYDKRGKNDWQKYRIRSGKMVADEFELLIKNYGAKFICIMDEDFNVYRSRVEEFIMEMKKRNLKVPFFFMGRAPYHLRDKDLLKPLREIGFVCGLIGLEAVDEDTLKKIHKNVEVDQVAETIQSLEEIMIMSVVTWMVGYPDDDEAK